MVAADCEHSWHGGSVGLCCPHKRRRCCSANGILRRAPVTAATTRTIHLHIRSRCCSRTPPQPQLPQLPHPPHPQPPVYSPQLLHGSWQYGGSLCHSLQYISPLQPPHGQRCAMQLKHVATAGAESAGFQSSIRGQLALHPPNHEQQPVPQPQQGSQQLLHPQAGSQQVSPQPQPQAGSQQLPQPHAGSQQLWELHRYSPRMGKSVHGFGNCSGTAALRIAGLFHSSRCRNHSTVRNNCCSHKQVRSNDCNRMARLTATVAAHSRNRIAYANPQLWWQQQSKPNSSQMPACEGVGTNVVAATTAVAAANRFRIAQFLSASGGTGNGGMRLPRPKTSSPRSACVQKQSASIRAVQLPGPLRWAGSRKMRKTATIADVYGLSHR